MRLYNTATRKIEEFKPSGDEVKIYTCGPTVYNYQHIGNFAAQIYWDLLVRALRAEGYKVRRVLNLTDVGHLVSDSDDGEDKLEKGAAREGKSVWEIAEFYANDFLDNYHKLNLSEPEKIARATDYIEEDKTAVDTMTKNGFTYEIEDGIYYDTSKFKNYADFARLNLEGLKAGARVEMISGKKNPTDFAVWKFIKPGEKHAMRWDYLGRPGYPGWHLECSTIIHTELGEPIDIHAGGIDHIPIHHTNEIAQSFALSGKPLATCWLHCNFITVKGEKISKSLGNVILIPEIEEKGYSALDYKMWVLSGHYQGARNFTFESLESARIRRLNWRNKIAECYQKELKNNNPNANFVANTEGTSNAVQISETKPSDTVSISKTSAFEKILSAVSNNLNSPEAFAFIDNSDLTLADWQKVDDLFGLGLIKDAPKISAEVEKLISDRETARKTKDYTVADTLRDKLTEENIVVKDTSAGPIWQYLR